jgi:arylformamidase
MEELLQRLDDVLKLGSFIDLSPTIESGMPRWVSHPPIIVNATINHEHDGYYCQTLNIPEHTGSHVDAPAHAHPGLMYQTIDAMPVQTLLAPAKVFDLRPLALAPGQIVEAGMLAEVDAVSAPLAAGEIALLNFGWWENYWFTDSRWRWYSENAPGLSEDACEWLADRRIVAAGADTVAFDIPMRDGQITQRSYAHEVSLLPRGIYLLECLANLDKLPTHCFFMALPLKIEAGSGSPLRAVAVVFEP